MDFMEFLEKLKPYSKAVGAVVGALAGIIATKIPGLDGPTLAQFILVVLTGLGAYAAPKNTEKPT